MLLEQNLGFLGYSLMKVSIHCIYVCVVYTKVCIHIPRHRKVYATLDMSECKYKFDNLF